MCLELRSFRILCLLIQSCLKSQSKQSKSFCLYYIIINSIMSKLVKTFTSLHGPKAIGPYSHATIYQGFMYISGQIGLNPKTNQLQSEDVEAQARRALDNMSHLLSESKSGLEDVIKTTIYLKTMADFGKVNKVYSEYFSKHYPARVCIAVSELPKNAKFQIDAIVAYPESKLL